MWPGWAGSRGGLRGVGRCEAPGAHFSSVSAFRFKPQRCRNPQPPLYLCFPSVSCSEPVSGALLACAHCQAEPRLPRGLWVPTKWQCPGALGREQVPSYPRPALLGIPRPDPLSCATGTWPSSSATCPESSSNACRWRSGGRWPCCLLLEWKCPLR